MPRLPEDDHPRPPADTDAGDLGFADASQDDQDSLRAQKSDPGHANFIPADHSEQPPESSTDSPDAGAFEKTWVKPTAEDPSVQDTYVPPMTDGPIDENAANENQQEDDPDPNKTWVPTSDLTMDGLNAGSNEDIQDLAEESNKDLHVDDTWTPTNAVPPANDDDEFAKTVIPTASDDDEFAKTVVPTDSDDDEFAKTVVPSASDEDEFAKTVVPDDPSDVDKTWVRHTDQTQHGLQNDAQNIDADATYVPSDNPDSAKTYVPTGDLTVDGLTDTHVPDHDADTENPADSDGANSTAILEGPTEVEGTMVMDADNRSQRPSDSAVAETVAGQVNTGMEQTQFSQTLSGRDLSPEEYKEWQQAIEDKTIGDTDVFDHKDGEQSDQASTQIWSKQSADGLSLSLTVRKRPVEGDGQFSSSLQNADEPDYAVIEKLAEGGMGAIYVARQTSLDRELAIKTLKSMRPSERKTLQKQGRISQVENQRREMFFSEALVTGNLVHPHIIPIHDLCQTADGTPFYSMKRVYGTPWNETITQLSLEENLDVLHKVCDAMAYAHHKGVVNRDLKPENIMLGEFGEVLVLDWGLAVPASRDDKKRFNSPSAPYGAGTPAYMSPELWTGPADAIGPWSDIYLLGAILFEIVTGLAPHEFPEPDKVSGNTGLWLIIDKVVRKNRIRATKHSGELIDIALKAMSTKPYSRHDTVLEFQEAVKEYQRHEESRRLAERAHQTLGISSDQNTSEDKTTNEKPTTKPDNYQAYQTAAALFEEAQVAWPENHVAAQALRQTRQDYAQLAYNKGDYDLGLQVAAQESGEEFTLLTNKLNTAKRLRNGLKTAMLMAVVTIVGIGIFASYKSIQVVQQRDEIIEQRDEIIELAGTRDALMDQAKNAEVELQLANDQTIQAQEKADAANQLIVQAEKQLDELTAKKEEAELLKNEAESNLAIAVTEREKADKARIQAENLRKQADDALIVAQENIQESEAAIARLNVEKQRLDLEKLKAAVELKNAAITGYVRSADYPRAIDVIDQMLGQDSDLQKLPKIDRDNRTRELKARRRQLLQRTTTNRVPINTQIIDPQGKTIAWCDAAGKLSLLKMSDASDRFPQAPVASIQLKTAASDLRFYDNKIIATLASELVAWDPVDDSLQTLTTHQHNIAALAQHQSLVLTGDTAGTIKCFDLKKAQVQWSVTVNSSVRDLAILHEESIFLYAGSRGGESADVMAYRLPQNSERPERLGQLRFPRTDNYPPAIIAISPDEKLLVIGNSRNGDLLVLPRRDTSNARRSDRFPFAHAADLAQKQTVTWKRSQHTRPVNDLQFSADGQRLVSASDDRTIGVWKRNENNLTLQTRMLGHGAKVISARFLDTTGQTVTSTSADRYCRLWNVQTYEQERRQIEQQFQIAKHETRPDRRQIAHATFSRQSTVQAHTLQSQSRRLTPQNHSRRQCISASWPAKNPLRIIQAATDFRNSDEVKTERKPVLLNTDGQQQGSINTLTIAGDGSQVITGAADGTAVIWDTRTGQPVVDASIKTTSDQFSAFEEGHDFNMARLRFLLPYGRTLLTSGFDGTLCLWNSNLDQPGTGAQQARIPGLGLVNATATSKDGLLIATSVASGTRSSGGSIALWPTKLLLQGQTTQPNVRLTGYHGADLSALAFNHDQTLLASGGRDGRVGIWNVNKKQLIAGSRIHAKNTIVSHLEFLPDGRLLSAGFDGKIQLLKIVPPNANEPSFEADQKRLGRLVADRVFAHDRIPVERISFANQGTQFVSISVRTDTASQSTRSELQLWSTTSTEPLRSIKPAIVQSETANRIAAIDWSPNDQAFTAVVNDRIQLFETATWKVTKVLQARNMGISDAVFAPEKIGRNLLATFDGTAAHFWDLNNYTHLADFRPMYAVQSIACGKTPQSNFLLVADRSVHVFEADQQSGQFGRTLFKLTDPHAGLVSALSIDPTDKSRFVTASADGSAKLWRWNSQTQSAVFVTALADQGAATEEALWSVNGQLALIRRNGTVELRGQRLSSTTSSESTAAVTPASLMNTTQLTIKAAEPVQLKSGAWSVDGHFFVVCGRLTSSGTSQAWIYDVSDFSKPRLHAIVAGHSSGGINAIRFLPHSPYLVSGGADGAVYIWNYSPHSSTQTEAYEAFQLLPDKGNVAHAAPVTDLVVSPDGNSIVTASTDGTAIVWPNPFQ